MKASEKLNREVQKIASKIKKNNYGDLDFSSIPVGARFVSGTGPHTRLPYLLRAYRVMCWRKGRPVKVAGRVVNDKIMKLLAAANSESKKSKKAAKKAAKRALREKAKAAGFASVSAWARAEKERKRAEAADAERQAVIAREQQRKIGLERLKALGFADREEFLPVLTALECAAADGFVVTAYHALAALYARKSCSIDWTCYCSGNMSASTVLRLSERALHRHERKNYAALLRVGLDREVVREITNNKKQAEG
jgi:hypothetical protein